MILIRLRFYSVTGAFWLALSSGMIAVACFCTARTRNALDRVKVLDKQIIEAKGE